MTRITAAIIIALIFSIFVGCGDAFAGDWMSWDERNTELNYYVVSLLAIDLGQTLYIADNPESRTEKNKYLGMHPSRTKVKQYFGWTSILIAGATFVLPKGWSHSFQNIVIFRQSVAVSRNLYRGVKIGFKF